ncbi:MAG TPA: hypothetical protein VF170_19635 [Planctomycetaceae bacterium]
MSISATAKWVLLALAGLTIAIAIAIAAANLTSQQIGIASESVSAGDALAPALNVPGEGRPQGESGDQSGPGNEGTTTPSSPPTATTTTEEPPAPEETTGPDDHGGESSDSDGDDD